jgi:biotin synthase
MTRDEIMECVHRAVRFGYGTVVMQAGEDYGLAAEWITDTINLIKFETDLAVVLSLGERKNAELLSWKEAGADRYLLRFETSDSGLYDKIHFPSRRGLEDRLKKLQTLKRAGYETGSGVMVGIPGQTFDSLVEDLYMFKKLDLDMIGIGPYIAHPCTSLGIEEQAVRTRTVNQVPNTELMTCKMLALTRIICPDTNIPGTTALRTIDSRNGYFNSLQRGANVIMPNLTPPDYQKMYEIYPYRTEHRLIPEQNDKSVKSLILSLGRKIGAGPGGRTKRTSAVCASDNP